MENFSFLYISQLRKNQIFNRSVRHLGFAKNQYFQYVSRFSPSINALINIVGLHESNLENGLDSKKGSFSHFFVFSFYSWGGG